MHRAIDEAELGRERRGAAAARDEPGAERLEDARQEEREWFEALHGPVELEAHLEALGGECRDERRVVFASRAAQQARTIGTKTRGQTGGRQPREVADRAQPPARQKLQALRLEIEECEWQRRQGAGFFAGRNDAEPVAAAGDDESRDAREGERQVEGEGALTGCVQDRTTQSVGRRPGAAEAVKVEQHRRRTGRLDAGREAARELEERLGAKAALSSNAVPRTRLPPQ